MKPTRCEIKSLNEMLNFFVTSLVSSIIECVILCIIGGATISSVWFIVLEIGFEEKSILFYLTLCAISIPVLWFALFWIKILYIPSSRGKLSIFSPLPTNICMIQMYKNEGIIPVVSGSWLIMWLFIITLGWSIAIRQDPISYKLHHKITGFHACCENGSGNFMEWYKKKYLPLIHRKQNLTLDQRKFIVYQPSASLNLEQQLNGLFSAFALSIISKREFLVDFQHEFQEVFEKPEWDWEYSKLFPSRPITHTILDFVTLPSYIVPPAHKWRWSDIVSSNISETLFRNDRIVMVDCDDFIAPLFWLNPLYRKTLCKICSIDQIYHNFAKVLLNWKVEVKHAADAISQEIHGNAVIAIADSRIASRSRLGKMLDTMMRCSDIANRNQKSWLIVKRGGGLGSFPKWDQIGPHNVYIYDDLECVKKMGTILRNAALHYTSLNATAIVGFTGSAIAESLAYGSGIPLYLVLHRVPFCGEVEIRIPCIQKWHLFLNSPGINITTFMTSEMSNQLKCRI